MVESQRGIQEGALHRLFAFPSRPDVPGRQVCISADPRDMGEVFNPGFARYSRQPGCSFDVDGAKRVPAALHVQAHSVYNAIGSLQGCGDLSLVVDIGSGGLQSGRPRSDPFGVPRGGADLETMAEKVAYHASAEKTSPAEHCNQPPRSSSIGSQDLPLQPRLFLAGRLDTSRKRLNANCADHDRQHRRCQLFVDHYGRSSDRSLI